MSWDDYLVESSIYLMTFTIETRKNNVCRAGEGLNLVTQPIGSHHFDLNK